MKWDKNLQNWKPNIKLLKKKKQFSNRNLHIKQKNYWLGGIAGVNDYLEAYWDIPITGVIG